MTGRYGAPCTHYSAADQVTCGATPTRMFIQGPLCVRHTPSAQRGRPQPPKGRCAPARCYCGRPGCPAYATYRREPQAVVDVPVVLPEEPGVTA